MAKRKEIFDEDEDDSDDEQSPPKDHCSQPTWSQQQFEELMKIQKQREQKTIMTTPAITTMHAMEPLVVTINHKVNDDSSEQTPSPLPFRPRLGDNEYNIRMYQEYQKTKELAENLNIAKIVEEAEVATGLKAKPQKKRKVSKAEEAKKQAREEKKMKKQEEKAAKEAETARLVQVRRDLDVLIDRFQPEYYACLEVQEEKKQGDKEDKDYSVVKWFYVKKGKPGEKKYDICDFNHQQLRKLAGKCNVKAAGTLNIWNCRTSIASFVTAGTMYKESTIANPFTDATQRRLNTFMRLINVCFSKNLVQRFVDLNDRKKREQYEAAHGGDPVKAFFVEASNVFNDASQNSLLSKVCASNEGEDVHLFGWMKEGAFNLSDFDPQTYATCYSKAYDLLKAREIALANMTESGTHESDFWNFCTNRKVLKWRVNGTELPAQAVYYVNVMCGQYPAIDGKFADRLHESMKSDSNLPMVGDAGGSGGGKDRKLTKGEREMMKRMDEAAQQQKQTADRSFKQREDFIALQKQKNEDDVKRASAADVRESWKEYVSLGKEFNAFMEEGDTDNNFMLKNLAKRLRSLENQLHIDNADSITQSYFTAD